MAAAIDPNKIPDDAVLLIGEGRSEEGFLKVLSRKYPHVPVFVCNCGGETKLKSVLLVLAQKLLTIKALGLMFDGNGAREQRVTSIANILAQFQIHLDKSAILSGQIDRSGNIPVCLFLSPGREIEGYRIEDLVAKEIETSNIRTCIEDYKNCLDKKTKFILPQKAVVQIFVTSRNESACGLGTAFEAGVLDIDHLAYQEPRTMFASLFEAVLMADAKGC